MTKNNTQFPNAMLIAEIGCVHAGDMTRAKMLITLAKENGADIAKFQKRNPEESTPKALWNQPHPNKMFSYGDTYLEHRKNLELTIEQHKELKDYCESTGIIYSTSVWDITSAKEIIELNPLFIKIPSAQNYNTELLKYIYDNYTGFVHISLGMTLENERKRIFTFITENDNRYNRTVIYHCTSAYPCPFENLYLREIPELCKKFPIVGFSNHGYGIAADIASYALGATFIERHFVDDRTFRHTDAAASLEPQGLQKLSRDLKAIQKAMMNKPEVMDKLEQEQRNKLRA